MSVQLRTVNGVIGIAKIHGRMMRANNSLHGTFCGGTFTAGRALYGRLR